MSHSRVVRPETTRLTISDGDWLLVKKRLTAGEERRMVKRGAPPTEGARVRIDLFEGGVAKILAYLLDWSLLDLDGAPIEIRDKPEVEVEAALDMIDPDSYGEILRAIETHEKAMADERDEEKKTRATATSSSATSPSRDGAAGGSTGSASSTPTTTG